MREISRRLKPRHRGSEEISGAGVGKRSRRCTRPSRGFYMGSGSRHSHILFSQPRESGWDAQVFTRSPQLERRNPQPLGPLTQNPPPAKAHAPLPGRPGPQAAQGAPLSSASGSSQAQLKLVRRSLIGSARLERCRGDRRSGRSVCGGPVFWEDATVLGLRRGVLLGYPGALFPGDLRTLLPPSLFPCMARRGSLQMGRIKIPTGSAPHPPAPAHKITRGRF